MDDPFYSSKFSIDWAKDHITELERELKEFFTDDAYTGGIEPDAEGIYNLAKVRLTRQMPRSLDGHIIDTIHNLRSALDQVIYSVALLNNTLHLKGTPSLTIRDDKAEFDRKVESVTGRWVPPEILAVVRAFEPYKGGNDLVWALNNMCNSNKHGFIRPVPITTASFKVEGMFYSGGPEIFHFPKWDHSKNEMVVARARVEDSFDLNFNFSLAVVFDDFEIVARKPVVPTLNEVCDMVNGIVIAIEAESRRIGLL